MSDSEAMSGTATAMRQIASPLARRLARMADLDLAEVEGSGPHGRIIKRDIETALAIAQRAINCDISGRHARAGCHGHAATSGQRFRAVG